MNDYQLYNAIKNFLDDYNYDTRFFERFSNPRFNVKFITSPPVEVLRSENLHGFTYKKNNIYYIYLRDFDRDEIYSPTCCEKKKRFTLAHEFGHIYLGHLDRKLTPEEYKRAEYQANTFAGNTYK